MIVEIGFVAIIMCQVAPLLEVLGALAMFLAVEGLNRGQELVIIPIANLATLNLVVILTFGVLGMLVVQLVELVYNQEPMIVEQGHLNLVAMDHVLLVDQLIIKHLV